MDNYIKIEFETEDALVKEQLIAILSVNGFEGFEETDKALLAYTGESAFSRPLLDSIVAPFSLIYKVEIVPQQNWNELWESNFPPVVIDDFCTVRAHFHPPATATAHEIVITPKMSFGTGHHATTWMMIKQMSQMEFAGKLVSDFGTGTGILAIMAEKLGAGKIVAIDNDEWSIENASENLARNNCTKIQLLQADHFTPGNKYDVILANINRNVIEENLIQLVNGLTDKGNLLLSGLLQKDETDIVRICEQLGLNKLAVIYRGEWISLQFNYNIY